MSLDAARVAGAQAAHFGSDEARQRAAHVGMWVFLGTELLLFAALFAGYAVYRAEYPAAFSMGKHHMEQTLGAINTYLLVGSSVLVALADGFVGRGRSGAAAALLLVAALLGLAFLSIKGVEYRSHFEEGLAPGAYFASTAFAEPGANLYITLYFLMTGLHALHLGVAIALLFTLVMQLLSGKFSPAYRTPVELSGMYWHLVDVVWLFLWALFYLV